MNKLEFIVVMIKLFLGGMQFVALRMIGQTVVENDEGKKVKFNASFFVAFVLFASVTFALIPYIYLKRKDPKGVSSITKNSLMKTGMSGSCDFAAQLCTIFTLGLIPASLVMVLKGSRALFSAGLSVVMLKRKLRDYQWVSLSLCLMGLGVASMGQYFSQTTHPKNLGLGISLVLIAEAFRSVRIVYDERLMRVDNYNPFMIIAIEGMTGTVFAVISLLVVNYIPNDTRVDGVYESFTNTMYMLGHSGPVIILLIATLPIWVNSMYLSGIFVTKLVSAVYNAVVTVLTVAVVWSVELILYYSTEKKYGDPWNNWSFMQIGGFVLILASTLMYDATWQLPKFFNYDSISNSSIGVVGEKKNGEESNSNSSTIEETTRVA